MLTRAVLAVALIAGAGVYARGASGPERLPERLTLDTLPASIDRWAGRDAPPLADDVVAQLGVDEYVHRTYLPPAGMPVSLYVGYYTSQRQGDTIHSPQNCLPGAGWQPVYSDRANLPIGGRTIPVNRFVIQKGFERQAVFYWYQGRGRVVANEFANKGWLMFDAATLRRTDGGLVRLITPIADSQDASFGSLAAFTAVLLPHLSERLP